MLLGEEVERTGGPFEADIPNLCVLLYVEIPEIKPGSVPIEIPPIKANV